MADQAAADAAAKNFFIEELNNNQTSLTYYLRHFCSLSSRAASSPSLTDISLTVMTLRTADGKTHTIPFEPPLKSWPEIPGRTQEMDKAARAGVDVRITEYERPRSIGQIVVFGLCVFAFTSFGLVKTGQIVPGGLLYDVVLPWFPGGPESFVWLVNMIALPTVGIHFAEAWYLDRTRLRKYGIERFSGLWLKWISSCLLEGRGTFLRLDARAKSMRAEKAKSG